MFLYLTITLLFIIDIYRSLFPHEFNLLVDIFYRYKNETIEFFKPKMVNLSYNLIYYYSYLQIKYTKFKILIKPFINVLGVAINNFLKNNNLINNVSEPPKLVFEIYGKGLKINNIFIDENNKKQLNTIFTENLKLYNDYDFVIFSDKINNNFTNKIHYYNFPNSFDNINYKISNIKFISMDLTFNNQTYPIELKNDIYNHYIVNNKLNSEFYKYYLQNILNVSIDQENNFDYKVQIIDHNVNILELSCVQELIIKENDYEIINLNKIQTIENDEQNDEQNNEQNDQQNDEQNDEQNNKNNEEPEYIKL